MSSPQHSLQRKWIVCSDEAEAMDVKHKINFAALYRLDGLTKKTEAVARKVRCSYLGRGRPKSRVLGYDYIKRSPVSH